MIYSCNHNKKVLSKCKISWKISFESVDDKYSCILIVENHTFKSKLFLTKREAEFSAFDSISNTLMEKFIGMSMSEYNKMFDDGNKYFKIINVRIKRKPTKHIVPNKVRKT